MATKWLRAIYQINMDVDSRDSQVAGNKHARQGLITTPDPATTTTVPILVSVPTHPISDSNSSTEAASFQTGVVESPSAPISQWRFDYCDLCDISVYTHRTATKDSHIQGAKHQANLKLAGANATAPVRRTSTSTARPSTPTPARIITTLAEGSSIAAPLATSSSRNGGPGGGSPLADGGGAIRAGDESDDDDDGSSDGWSDDFKDNSDGSFAGGESSSSLDWNEARGLA